MVWVWLAILAAEVAALAVRRIAGGAAAPAVRRVEMAAAAIVAIVLLLPSIAEMDARRDQADRSDDVHAQAWLDQTLPVLEPNAVIVSWWSTSTPLWYAQRVIGERPDVFIVDDRTMLDMNLGRAPDVIERFLAEGKPVYAIRIEGPDLDELKGQFDMTLVASGSHTGVWKVNGYGVTLQ